MQLVLLIETDIRASKEFERYLAGNRFRFVNTTSSKKGLEYAKSAPPDLLVIGFHPEERDAVDTLIYLKRDPITKYIPVLALIRESNQPFIDYLQRVGISGFLNKPVKQNELVQKINELLHVSEKIRANIVKETHHHVTISLNNEQRTVITFRSGIKNYVLPEIRNVLSHDFIKSIINKHICIDIRTLPEMNQEELQILEKILKLFGDKKISLITGTHLGNIMKNGDLPDYINLFLSMDDYELFLENPELDE